MTERCGKDKSFCKQPRESSLSPERWFKSFYKLRFFYDKVNMKAEKLHMLRMKILAYAQIILLKN